MCKIIQKTAVVETEILLGYTACPLPNLIEQQVSYKALFMK